MNGPPAPSIRPLSFCQSARRPRAANPVLFPCRLGAVLDRPTAAWFVGRMQTVLIGVGYGSARSIWMSL